MEQHLYEPRHLLPRGHNHPGRKIDLKYARCCNSVLQKQKYHYVNKKQVRAFNYLDLLFLSGAPGPIRTADTRFRRAVLYPLSYEGMWDILLT